MAEFYRFFDSTIDDIREYTADEFSEYFRMVLTNGIYNGGTNLQVSAGGGDMTVDVANGYAIINGYMYEVDGAITLPIETADTLYNRIDRIVLRWDIREESRFIKAMVLKGVAQDSPVAPSLTRTDEIYELSLAQVFVKAGTNNIAGSAVTDERLNTEVCGIFNSRIQADTTEIFNQFQAWYNEKTVEYEGKWGTWYDTNIPAFEQAWNAWYTSKIPAYEQQWDTWWTNNPTEYAKAWDAWFQTQTSEGLIPIREKGVANGVATLDENGKVPLTQVSIPEMVASNVTIADGGNMFNATNVEDALSEAMSIMKTGRLGQYCKIVSDWNDATENGFYMGSNVANAPTTEWFIGIVISHNHLYCEQRIVAFSSTMNEYVRYLVNGVWWDWKKRTVGDLNALSFGSKTDIVTSMNELFQYASNGKSLIANAVTGKGVPTNAGDTFAKMATNISNIKVGDYKVGDLVPANKVSYQLRTNADFTPFSTTSYSIEELSIDSQNNIVVGIAGGQVTKLDPKGNVIWTVYLPSSVSGLFAGTSNVYASCTGGVYIYDTNIGTLKGTISLPSIVVYDITEDYLGNIYLACSDTAVRQYNSSLVSSWKYNLSANGRAVTQYGGSVIMVGSDDGYVRTLNAFGVQTYYSKRHSNWVRQVLIADGSSYFSCGDDRTLSKMNGSLVTAWTFSGHTGYVMGIAVDGNTYVYSISYDNTIRKIDASRGLELNKFTIPALGRRIVRNTTTNALYYAHAGYKVENILESYQILG